ncbi:MAG: alpha/beta fold hydrolase [Acidimicrobiales bacterium]|nr:alpha/beta fold hydrolase [Acidimicrobiales bacterium]
MVKAQLPPETFPGYDPTWSRLVKIPAGDQTGDGSETITLHVLDHCIGPAELTLLCVHGNPSWSYLWRNVIAQARPGVRVVALDQVNMGWSDRIDRPRILTERIGDLDALTDVLAIDTPVVTLAHDWGGPISLGWAQSHVSQLAGVILTNTSVHQPPNAAAPRLITVIRTPGLLGAMTQRTPAFIRGGLRLSSPEPPSEVRHAFLAPYLTPARRAGIRDFVEDIPLEPDHVSFAALQQVEARMPELAHVPALLLWGTKDPVFNELYLRDLEERLPHADVHRFTSASHFVSEDAPVAEAVWAWIESLQDRPEKAPIAPSVATLVPDLSSSGPLVTEWSDGAWKSIAGRDFLDRVYRIARGLVIAGIRPGDRIATMIPPGIDLTAVVYACWQIGTAAVLIDSGLGVRNMHRAARAADPHWLIGIPPAMVASKALGWNGKRIVAGEMDSRLRSALGVSLSLREVELTGEGGPLAVEDEDPLAAILFTSGSTGPSKGVRYRRSQLAAQRDIIAELYQITPSDRLVAAFAPFALYGPAMGLGSVVPQMDVTKPGSLTASALADAAGQIDATIVFASPSALKNVVATADSLTGTQKRALERLRLVMSAGAPIAQELLSSVATLCLGAAVHSPYGMTEVLPVADISLAERVGRGPGPGACVGRPLAGVDVRIDPFKAQTGYSAGEAQGEVLVRAAHQKQAYQRLWWTEQQTRTADGWHRTGDTGWVDREGYLWITGRMHHVISTADGPVTPIPIEHVVEQVPGVERAAAVGVGPADVQVVVVVLELTERSRTSRAATELTKVVRTALREASLAEPAAVLTVTDLPVDKRHNSKVDRSRVGVWAGKVLAGKTRVRL